MRYPDYWESLDHGCNLPDLNIMGFSLSFQQVLATMDSSLVQRDLYPSIELVPSLDVLSLFHPSLEDSVCAYLV